MNKINLYLVRLTSKYILLNTLLISIIILFVNILEISRITSNKMDNINVFILLSILKLPSIISDTVPFIIILSIAFLYRNLISNNEFISLRNIGFSILDIFKPVALTIFIFGIIVLIFLNPISANFENKFSQLTSKSNTDVYSIKFINNGMWIKNTTNTNEKKFINIGEINLESMNAKKIKILNIQKNNIKLITAKNGVIQDKIFILNDVLLTNIENDEYENKQIYELNLNFNKKNIIDSILNYKFIPFYKYKIHISNLKKFNLYSSEISLFYLSEVLKPLFLVIIGFVVMGYSGKFQRNENFFKVLFISVLIGFLIFLLKEIIINLTGTLDINFIFSYIIIMIIPLTIGLYQIIGIELD